MQSSEHREQSGEANKSKKPLKASIFDRPGPLFPGFEPGTTHNFDQEMKRYRRGMIGLGGIAVLAFIVGTFCSPNKRK